MMYDNCFVSPCQEETMSFKVDEFHKLIKNGHFFHDRFLDADKMSSSKNLDLKQLSKTIKRDQTC